MAKLMITWRTAGDSRVCKICQALEGYTWIFDTSTGESMSNELTHPVLGVVWNVQIGSQAHGHTRASCRCHMEPQLDFSDFLPKAENLLKALEAET